MLRVRLFLNAHIGKMVTIQAADIASTGLYRKVSFPQIQDLSLAYLRALGITAISVEFA